ncbi:MAG: Ppx/GppA family phosphatase [Phycisphaeraceae bacterium]|nr:MAG: Ppx/GppA family phosphatase [Phycisphaeraceae bacterium]
MSTEPQQQHSSPGRRLAAVDVGTNSIRLIIAEASPDGSYRILDDEKETTRLGQGMASNENRISPEAIDRSAEAVERMKRIAEGYGVEAIRIVGTAALRDAVNSDDFVNMVREDSGLEVQIISAEEEARLAHLSVSRAFDLESVSAAVVDIGGGSMEVILTAGGLIERVYTLPLGAVRLTDTFGGPEVSTGERFREMRDYIDEQLKEVIGEPPFVPQLVIGTGGTLTTLGALSIQRHRLGEGGAISPGDLRAHEVQRSELRHLVDWLSKMPVAERASVPGLPAERADIIVAGLTAAERLMKRLDVNTMRIHDRGIRDGLLLTMVEEIHPSAERPRRDDKDRMASVRRFAAKCDFDRIHCDHVAKLSMRIFDQLALHADEDDDPPEWTTPAARDILEAAAILHDVGYHINYSRHHHHSYHLIVHADLQRFSAREIELIANIARYHRKSAPKKKHQNYAKLKEHEQELINRLAAILRVADGLDRTHMQSVHDVVVSVSDGVARFEIHCQRDPGVDIWGATRKQDLFQKVFDMEPRFEWVEESAPTPPHSQPAMTS